jgi:hypothetical protein
VPSTILSYSIVADSAETTGLKWVTPAGGGMTLLSTTTLSGSSTSITGISQDYIQLYVLLRDVYGSGVGRLKFGFNSDGTAANFYSNISSTENGNTYNDVSVTDAWFGNGFISDSSSQINKLNGFLSLPNYTSTGTKFANQQVTSILAGGNKYKNIGGGIYIDGSAISSIQVGTTTGTFTDGTVLIYGVK